MCPRATYHIAPSVFSELGADVISIGVQPDGFNINEGVGSTDTAPCQRGAGARVDLGIAFDGDGDRVLFVDGKGRTGRWRRVDLHDRHVSARQRVPVTPAWWAH